MSAVLPVVGLAVMAACLLLVPLGLPGTWLMLLVVGTGALLGEVTLGTLALLVGVAALGEAAEFLLVKKFSERYGASRRAFWGALLGGLVGIALGAPVPVVGSLLAGLLGTFVGAVAVALWEGHPGWGAVRSGWGAVLGRAAAVAVKTGAGVVVLVVGGGALLV